MNPVVHFEMPYDDPRRMARFYEQAFGWQTQALGAEMDNCVLATPPSVVIAVDNIGEATAKVRLAGGTVPGEPMARVWHAPTPPGAA
jgi:predicted enzyme related to lactoylglutathione lyase